jgi:hypothetical protein
MDTSVLRKIARREPFKAFALRMNDGREYDIRHPEFIYVAERHVAIVSERDDSTYYLEPALIATIQYATEPLS